MEINSPQHCHVHLIHEHVDGEDAGLHQVNDCGVDVPTVLHNAPLICDPVAYILLS